MAKSCELHSPALEKALSNIRNESQRDLQSSINPRDYSYDAFYQLETFLDDLLPSGIHYTRAIIVRSPDYQRSLEVILRSAKPVELQSYFIWILIQHLEALIPPRYITPILRYFDAPQERSQLCLWTIQEDLDGLLTYFLSKRHLKTAVAPRSKAWWIPFMHPSENLFTI